MSEGDSEAAGRAKANTSTQLTAPFELVHTDWRAMRGGGEPGGAPLH